MMTTELQVRPKSLGGLVRSLSGLFITRENPNGLTPKECVIIGAFRFLLSEDQPITQSVKTEVCNMTNHSFQVITNYVNKFRKKGVIVNDKLHPIFYKQKVTIYGKDTV